MQEKLIDGEKEVDRLLYKEVQKLGGLSIKLSAQHFTGLPDRLILLPKGNMFFVEVKTTNKKPRRIQLFIIEMIRQLGYSVYVVDTKQGVYDLIEQYKIKL